MIKKAIFVFIFSLNAGALTSNQLWGMWSFGHSICSSNGQILETIGADALSFFPDGTMTRMIIGQECLSYAIGTYSLKHDVLTRNKMTIKNSCGNPDLERPEVVSSLVALDYDHLLMNYPNRKCDEDRGFQQIELNRIHL